MILQLKLNLILIQLYSLVVMMGLHVYKQTDNTVNSVLCLTVFWHSNIVTTTKGTLCYCNCSKSKGVSIIRMQVV